MDEEITFRIAGTVLSYPADMAPYMQYRGRGTRAAMDTSLDFIEQYRQWGSLRRFCAEGFDWGRLAIARAVRDAVQCAVDAGRYDINETAFTALDTEGLLIRPWQEAFQQVYDRFVDLETEKLSEAERRRIRKELRDRFTGGGFGLDAAIWASLEAGAVNLVTGAAHSVFNALGNLVTSVRISGKESAIYDDPETLRTLQRALARCVDTAFSRILPMRVLGLVPTRAPREDFARAAAIMDNIVHGRIPQEKEMEPLLAVLRTMPADPRTYRALRPHLTSYEDVKALADMANFFLIPQTLLARRAADSAVNGDDPDRTALLRRAASGDADGMALLSAVTFGSGNAEEGEAFLWSSFAAKSPEAAHVALALLRAGRDVPFLGQILLASAGAGDPAVLLELGRLYAAGGNGFPQDAEKAAACFRRCLEGTDALRRSDAAYELAKLYRDGALGAPDEAQALKYLTLSSEGGNKDASAALVSHFEAQGDDLAAFPPLCRYLSLPQESPFAPGPDGRPAFTGEALSEASAAYSLGLVYELGPEAAADALDGLYDNASLRADPAAARRAYARAAAKGCAPAACRLARLLETGGTPEDAARVWEEAAAMGSAEAALHLGELYSADGPARDADKAMHFYETALAAGEASAALPLARLYETAGRTDDARALYQTAADEGDDEAALRLAQLLDRDGADFDDLHQALLYYTQAALHHEEAALRAGLMYDEGIGTPPNPRLAIPCLDMADRLGSAEGAYRLGLHYETGDGTEKNDQKAALYYERAMHRGHSEAARALAALYVAKGQLARARTIYSTLARQGDQDAAKALSRLAPPPTPAPEKEDSSLGGFFKKFFK